MSHDNEDLFDQRTVEKNIRRGLVTRKQYDTYLKQLADASDNAEYISIEDPEDDGDDVPEAVVEA